MAQIRVSVPAGCHMVIPSDQSGCQGHDTGDKHIGRWPWTHSDSCVSDDCGRASLHNCKWINVPIWVGAESVLSVLTSAIVWGGGEAGPWER